MDGSVGTFTFRTCSNFDPWVPLTDTRSLSSTSTPNPVSDLFLHHQPPSMSVGSHLPGPYLDGSTHRISPSSSHPFSTSLFRNTPLPSDRPFSESPDSTTENRPRPGVVRHHRPLLTPPCLADVRFVVGPRGCRPLGTLGPGQWESP